MRPDQEAGIRANIAQAEVMPSWMKTHLMLLAEIDRLRAAMTWQPIETAPKDGTFFLGRYSFVSDETDEDDNVIRRNVVTYAESVAYYFGGAIVEAPYRGGICTNLIWTHWIPIPGAPEAGL